MRGTKLCSERYKGPREYGRKREKRAEALRAAQRSVWQKESTQTREKMQKHYAKIAGLQCELKRSTEKKLRVFAISLTKEKITELTVSANKLGRHKRLRPEDFEEEEEESRKSPRLIYLLARDKSNIDRRNCLLDTNLIDNLSTNE